MFDVCVWCSGSLSTVCWLMFTSAPEYPNMRLEVSRYQIYPDISMDLYCNYILLGLVNSSAGLAMRSHELSENSIGYIGTATLQGTEENSAYNSRTSPTSNKVMTFSVAKATLESQISVCLSAIAKNDWIEPIEHRVYWAYWPSSLLTIEPIDHWAYRPLSLSTIEPIDHWAYWPLVIFRDF